MTDSTPNRTASRLKLIAVFSVFAVPFIIATVWFNQLKTEGESAGNRANGELVAPARPLAEFEQTALEGATVAALADIKDQWTVVYFHQGDCGELCQKTLYDSRQVHISLGKEMHRVRRLFVTDTPLVAEVSELHLQLQTSGLDASDKGLMAQIREHVGAETFDADSEQLYLVDPLGNLMMRFPSELPQKLFLKDLKVLLKASRIG